MTTSVGFLARTSFSNRFCRSGTLLPLIPAPITSMPRSLCLSASSFLIRVTYPVGRTPAWVIESPRKMIFSPFFRDGSLSAAYAPSGRSSEVMAAEIRGAQRRMDGILKLVGGLVSPTRQRGIDADPSLVRRANKHGPNQRHPAELS